MRDLVFRFGTLIISQPHAAHNLYYADLCNDFVNLCRVAGVTGGYLFGHHARDSPAAMLNLTMAGPAENGTTKRKGPRVRTDLARSPNDPRGLAPTEVGGATVEPDQVRVAAARLFAMGYKRTEIVKMLRLHLITDEMKTRPVEQQMFAARGKIRRWETQQSFRDLVWEQGLTQLDLRSGTIMKGLAKKAEKGRVDAARLIFEITGRHNPKGDERPTQIALVVNGVPRPLTRGPDGQAVVAELEDGSS